MREVITSTQNPKIKNLKKLDKASERREQGVLLIEGLREVLLAYRAGYEITALYICEDIVKDQEEYKLSELPKSLLDRAYYLSVAVYNTVAYRETTEGIIATAKPKELSLANLKLSEKPLILVIEAVEKPGNLGAMLRTCDAAAVDAVIVCDPKTDAYNPNAIRSSVGTVFTNQIALCHSGEAIAYLKEKGITTFAAELSATKAHYQQDFVQGTAIVVGTEATGLSNEWMNAANEKIKIPMLGQIDSLNVSVSAAVLLFEARRQRAL
ncbi:MAG: RNA methyltransferase [Bacteroidetes bacterium]|nr:RNA methyltransferase [Bacteroidota bacterium]